MTKRVKRGLAYLLAASMAMSTWSGISAKAVEVSSAGGEIEYRTNDADRDVNGDSSVDGKDVLNILQIASGEVSATEAQRLKADMNGDGSVTAVDALLLLKQWMEEEAGVTYKEIQRDTAKVTGYGDSSSNWKNAWDDSTATTPDLKKNGSYSSDAGWTQLELDELTYIDKLSFYPRDRYPQRMIGGSFTASTESDMTDTASNSTVLYSIEKEPTEGIYQEVELCDVVPYRYVRYNGPKNGYLNVGDIKLYTIENVPDNSLKEAIAEAEQTDTSNWTEDAKTAVNTALALAKKANTDEGRVTAYRQLKASILHPKTKTVLEAKNLLEAEIKKLGDVKILDTLEALPSIDSKATITWSCDSDFVEVYNNYNSVKAYQQEQDEIVTLVAAISYQNDDPETVELPITILNKNTRFTYDSINPGQPLYDNNGVRVQAHGGCVEKFTVNGRTRYYWYGEDKTHSGNPVDGIHCYSSKDLYNWTDEGLVFIGSGDAHDDAKDVQERPKVIYNEKNNNYVLFYHADNSNYSKAKLGIAVSDSPTGPFIWQRSIRLYGLEENLDSDDYGMTRDMTVYVDDDQTAYVFYSSEQNMSMYVAKLNEDYTDLSSGKTNDQGKYIGEEGVDFARIIPNDKREAPAVFKHNGTYYLVSSWCSGWTPNNCRYYTAKSIMGPWTNQGDPCKGSDLEDKEVTYRSQPTYVVPIDPENGEYMYLGDRWYFNSNPYATGDLWDSRYIWLPMTIDENGKLSMEYKESWKLPSGFEA